MVSPIYGQFPEFGIRELLQNSIDAVLERRQYSASRKIEIEHYDADVVVELSDGDQLTISIRDTGIGMTPEIVRDYFVRAGASFRDSRRWREEYVGSDGSSLVRRSGRFGVGVFAGFLLGEKMEITTRHVSSNVGVSFAATNGSELMELTKVTAPIGTSIIICLSEEVAETFLEQVWPRCAYWYALNDPRVVFRHKTADASEALPQAVSITPSEADGDVVDWNSFRPSGFAGVSWTSNLDFGLQKHEEKRRGTTREQSPLIYCNGFLIGAPNRDDEESMSAWGREDRRPIEPASYSWSKEHAFHAPTVLIYDHEGSLPLTLRRDQLAGPLPFESALAEDIVLDYLAWCIATAPRGPVWESAFTSEYLSTYPLVKKRVGLGSAFRWLCSEEPVPQFCTGR